MAHEEDSRPLLGPDPEDHNSSPGAVADEGTIEVEQVVKYASEAIQKLSSYNHQIENEILRLVRREVGSRARHNIHDLIASATNLSYDIGKQLDPKTGALARNRIVDKLRVGFAREVKKLNQLGKDLAAQERKMVVFAQMDSSNLILDMEDVPSSQSQRKQEEIQVQMHVMDPDLQLLNQRQAAMQEINKDVRLLNEMMLDLAYLVEEQQEMVDHISMNIDNAKTSVQRAEDEVLVASRYQSQARSRWCCFLLILTVILLVLVLIIYLFVS